MNDLTPAQEEFNQLLANSSSSKDNCHPQDRSRSHSPADIDEEDAFRAAQIEAAMRHTPSNSLAMQLPPASFDANAATGVKGVIADARAYEAAKRNKFKTAMRSARQSIFGNDMAAAQSRSRSSSKGSVSDTSSIDLSGSDEESFLAQWRESRRKELETEGKAIRTRRTSPSVRVYGRFDEVDALGYLDAIEKVSRDTTVVVFVYDPECEVSSEVEQALVPLVAAHPTTHFVKVHYEEIEFDAAAVPTVLAYRNQGDLVANLTGIIEMMPDSETFGTPALKQLLQQHGALP